MSGKQLERRADGTVRSPDKIVPFAFAALAFGLVPDSGIEPVAFN